MYWLNDGMGSWDGGGSLRIDLLLERRNKTLAWICGFSFSTLFFVSSTFSYFSFLLLKLAYSFP